MKQKKNNVRQYFIKDESLENLSEDEFYYEDIAQNLKLMIESTKLPFNIGIVGKWGLGKSSLINILKDELKNILNDKQKNKYLITEVNAWKYENDSLKHAIVRELIINIEGNYESIYETITKFTEKVSKIFFKENPKLNEKWWNRNKIFLASTISILIFFYIGMSYLNTFEGVSPGNSAAISAFLAIASIILPQLVNAYVLKEPKTLNVNYKLEKADEYDFFLENITKDKKETHIIIIDDLDRLSIEKIVSSLNALKAFINFKNFIFIVPFDEGILTSALSKRRNINSDHQTIESELILDKLFQYRVYLTPLILRNIKD